MNIDKRLKQVAKEMAEKVSDSNVFLVMFNESMIEEVAPLIQMGLAVYMDKPIYLLVPEADVATLPENLKRLARGIEVYDRTLPQELMLSSMQAATMRLLEGQITDGGGTNETTGVVHRRACLVHRDLGVSCLPPADLATDG